MLLDNWRAVLLRAWSLRFMALAGALSIAEAVLPSFQDVIPAGVFGWLSIAATGGAFIARLVAQEGLAGHAGLTKPERPAGGAVAP